ncbi:MAG: hypothetical protein J4431_04415 [Candidatus Aenigmarchaeota archaeon]|nr:hypothetical protein [Candidatus Aenigmarchaeota archaeon]
MEDMKRTLLMVVLIFTAMMVIMMVINEYKNESEAEAERYIKTFEPGLLTIEKLPERAPLSCKLMGGSYDYAISLPGIGFATQKDPELSFIVVAELRKNLMVLGQLPEWKAEKNRVLSLEGEPFLSADLYAELHDEVQEIDDRTAFVRLTAWRNSDCIKRKIGTENIIVEEGTNKIADSSYLLDQCPESYLNSASIGLMLQGTCAGSVVCEDARDEMQCNSIEPPYDVCYYERSFLAGAKSGGQCFACPVTETCSDYTPVFDDSGSDKCTGCAWARANCEWSGNECRDKPA